MPEDFVMDVIEKITEGKRKCYLKDYRTFKGSIYYHLRNEMLTYFRCRKRKHNDENENQNIIPIDDAMCLSYDDNIDYSNENLFCEEIIEKVEKDELRKELLNLFDPNKEVEEIFVLEGILEGKKRWEIAEDLGITENEVTVIQKRIYRKIKKRIDPLKIDGQKYVKYN